MHCLVSRGRKNPTLLFSPLRMQKASMSENILSGFAATYDYILFLLYFSESVGTIMFSVLYRCNFCGEIANIILFFGIREFT